MPIIMHDASLLSIERRLRWYSYNPCNGRFPPRYGWKPTTENSMSASNTHHPPQTWNCSWIHMSLKRLQGCCLRRTKIEGREDSESCSIWQFRPRNRPRCDTKRLIKHAAYAKGCHICCYKYRQEILSERKREIKYSNSTANGTVRF